MAPSSHTVLMRTLSGGTIGEHLLIKCYAETYARNYESFNCKNTYHSARIYIVDLYHSAE